LTGVGYVERIQVHSKWREMLSRLVCKRIDGYSAMNVSPQNPRSIFAGLVLFGGWSNIVFGTFILLMGGKDGLGIGFNFLASGAILISVIYYRERSRKAA
jgi:hypothetical protein